MRRAERYSRTSIAVALLVVLALSGCGTRVKSQSAQTAQDSAARSSALGFDSATAQADRDDRGPSSGTGPAVGGPASLAASASGEPAASGGGRTASTGSTTKAPASSSAATASGGNARTNTAPNPSQPSPGPGKPGAPNPLLGPGGGSPAETGGGPRSPVVLASIGHFSGPAGTVCVPVLQGLQMWVQHVNAHNGLNGHRVTLRVYDDSADPARHRAAVQQAVEREGVMAFVSPCAPFTGQSSLDYVNAKRVPVIGSETGSAWVYKSPMYFPQASSDSEMWLASVSGVAGTLVPKGKTKLGLIYCAEANGCSQSARIFEERAKGLGLEIVYEAKTSLAQPDFTAECLASRNAGAQVLFILLDSNSVGRVASSCSRQGFRPTYAGVAPGTADNFKDNPELEGMVVVSVVSPYYRNGTPATDEYQQAVKTSKVTNGGGPTIGWVAGKLVERASANLPEPPTSQAILVGLWSIKGDDLGGLTQPLTFVENQPAPPSACWFMSIVQKKTWVSPDDFTRHCAPEAYPV